MINLSSGLVGRFWVQGRPRTKGSMKCVGQKGKHVLVEDHKLSRPWKVTMIRVIRDMILDYTLDGNSVDGPRGWEPYTGDVEVRAVFFFERQQSVNGGIIPSHRISRPTSPDIGDDDKLTRNLLDALQESGLIKDDKNVCRIIAEKRWAAAGNPGGVQVHVIAYPADEIEVTSIDQEARQYMPIEGWMDSR